MTKDMAYDRLPTIRSRTLRREATPAERKLWSALRNRELEGFRFNFQVPIGPFIGDFVARSAKLIIEVDGSQHGEQIGYDQARTHALHKRGYRVIRFWNDDVLRNLNGVVQTILDALREPRSTPPRPPEREGTAREASQGRACGFTNTRPSSTNDTPSPLPLRGSSLPLRREGQGRS